MNECVHVQWLATLWHIRKCPVSIIISDVKTTISLLIIALKTDNRFQKSKTDYWFIFSQLYVFVYDCLCCDK